jgi:hypothetical protein
MGTRIPSAWLSPNIMNGSDTIGFSDLARAGGAASYRERRQPAGAARSSAPGPLSRGSDPHDHRGRSGLAVCYKFSMNTKRLRRAGATETFSVSVDADTKRALRALADREFGGNLSALVSDFAEDARRRLAAGAYLRKHRIPKLTAGVADLVQAEIDGEIASARRRRRRRVAA